MNPIPTIQIQILLLSSLLFGCGLLQQSTIQEENDRHAELRIQHARTEFLPIKAIDFSTYEQLIDLQDWPIDTTTPSNWDIQYLVKNDSTIDQDIYIQISKGDFSSVYKGENLLKYRRYFIPSYLMETDDHIIMKHGCATDCSAILLLSKSISNESTSYSHIVDLNQEKNLLVYVTDSSYQFENQMFQVAAVDLITDTQVYMTLPNICIMPYKPSCIDTIIYNKQNIEIIISLRRSLETVEIIQKRHILTIPDR